MDRKDIIQNILAIWKVSTPQEKRDGIVWYLDAYKSAQQISIKYNVPDHIVVGVIAALSPNNNWDINIRNAEDLIAGYLDGYGLWDLLAYLKDNGRGICTYTKMSEKAWSILDAMPDYDQTKKILNGQKIVCFFQNIMGEDTCTIDGHARNIAYAERVNLTDNKTNIGVKEYRELQQAYIDAAKKLRYQNKRIKAYELQAITWVAWRRMHGIV